MTFDLSGDVWRQVTAKELRASGRKLREEVCSNPGGPLSCPRLITCETRIITDMNPAYRRGATPYTLTPTPYTLTPTLGTLHPTPSHLHSALYTLHPTPSPRTLHPTPYTLHPTPYTLHPTPTSERRGNNLKGFTDFNLKAEARIWPWLSYMCHICSKAVRV